MKTFFAIKAQDIISRYFFAEFYLLIAIARRFIDDTCVKGYGHKFVAEQVGVASLSQPS